MNLSLYFHHLVPTRGSSRPWLNNQNNFIYLPTIINKGTMLLSSMLCDIYSLYQSKSFITTELSPYTSSLIAFLDFTNLNWKLYVKFKIICEPVDYLLPDAKSCRKKWSGAWAGNRSKAAATQLAVRTSFLPDFQGNGSSSETPILRLQRWSMLAGNGILLYLSWSEPYYENETGRARQRAWAPGDETR